MEDKNKVWKNVFVWQITNFLEFEEESIESSIFRLGRYECVLRINKIDGDIDKKCYKVFIEAYNGRSINYKSFCRLIIINGRGEECLYTELSRVKCKKYTTMMTIMHSDLICEENNRFPGGDLTFRLLCCDKEDDNTEASDLNSEKEQSKLVQTVSEELYPLYKGTEGPTDCVLQVGDSMIPVHSAVLSNCSEVFADMFRRYTSENRTDAVVIPDVDVTVFTNVLHYVYLGQNHGMTLDNLFPMYAVADKYALVQLREHYETTLTRILTIENVCVAAKLVPSHGETKLEKVIVKFVKENFEEIEETDDWKELLNSEPHFAFKLLRSAFMMYKHKDNRSSSKQ